MSAQLVYSKGLFEGAQKDFVEGELLRVRGEDQLVEEEVGQVT